VSIFDLPTTNTENLAKLDEMKFRKGITYGMRKPCTESRYKPSGFVICKNPREI
jgi:hypothetical protein